ncbi:MAG: COX15/CtaA family protein [Myxococcota bacterium]
MVARYTTYLLLAMVFGMILLGGIVHGTGSSLACPDWPLCYGEVMPEMTGGILFEHSHRLLGAAIGIAVIVLSVGLYRIDRRRVSGGFTYGVGLAAVLGQLAIFGVAVSSARLGSLWLEALLLIVFALAALSLFTRGMRLTAFGLVALELVVIQGLLGGITVVMRLPPLVSTIHLGIAMALLGGLTLLAFRLTANDVLGTTLANRGLLAVAGAAVFVQIVLGAFMRHTGSTLACGTELLTCQGAFFGAGGAAHTAWLHRWFAFLVAALVIAATVPVIRAARRRRRQWVPFFAISAHGLLVLQIVLGFAALVNYVPVSLATMHQGVGALLLVSLSAAFASAGPLGNRFDAVADQPRAVPSGMLEVA